MIKLHCFDRSPFAWKVRFVLAMKNVEYEMVTPVNKAEDPAFARLNPFRLTPVLELPDGRSIYESTVVNEYIEERWPDPPMLPRDPFERARVRMIEDVSDQYLYPVIRGFVTSQFDYAPPRLVRKKPDQVDRKLRDESLAKVHDHLARLEGELSGRTWFGAEVLSLADAALVPSLTGSLRLLGVLPDARYGAIETWSARIMDRAVWRASAPKEPPVIVES